MILEALVVKLMTVALACLMVNTFSDQLGTATHYRRTPSGSFVVCLAMVAINFALMSLMVLADPTNTVTWKECVVIT